MNANAIQIGYDYAYSRQPKKGEFDERCTKVQVLAMNQRRAIGNNNKTTRVVIQLHKHNGIPYTKLVDARNLIDYWDDYELDRRQYFEQREVQRQQWHEKRDRNAVDREIIDNQCAIQLGLCRGAILSVNEQQVVVMRSELERRLNIDRATV